MPSVLWRFPPKPTAHWRWQVRWDVFNLLNATNFDVPNRVFGTSNFGRVFSAKSSSEMQLGLNLAF